MIVTYNWLKEFVDFDYSPQELCDRLTMVGLEVDALEEIGGGLESVIVAKLESVEKHPEADRLTVCQVNNGSEIVQVVCGATNHLAGDLVALAQPGSVLPGEFKIKKSKIRGQVSLGMLCSEKELGIAEEAAGIIILPEGLTLGLPVFEALKLKDYQIEIGLTPNRPDCLSIVGVAREVAAMCGKPLHLPDPQIEDQGQEITQKASVTIEDAELCPRYAARMITGVKIGPSPDWIVRRLEAVGMRSINNVVDVTNYVMMELGHPLHAFDYRLLEEGRIVVKRAHQGEKFISLDDQEHNLSSEDLMICDGKRPVAMAGVMGGQNSEVQDDTETILLEAAYFKPTAIRRTSKRHGMHTESSHRFERGADIDMVPVALDRAASLIAELGQGALVAGVIDNYPQQLKTPVLSIDAQNVEKLLGIPVACDQVEQLLDSIGLNVSAGDSPSRLQVTVPSFRPDLEREVDLIEEVARLYGYEHIPTTMPVGTVDAPQAPLRQQLQKQLRDTMVAKGFSEAMNYSFISTEALAKLGLPADDQRLEQVKLLNPLTEDQSVMRTSLVPSLLDSVARNLAYRSNDLRLFELRPVFLPLAGAETCQEDLRLCGVLCGRQQPEGWSQSATAVDFYDLKGIAEELFCRLQIDRVDYNAERSEPYLHPGKSCTLLCQDRVLGTIGEVHPQVLAEFDIDQPVFLLDIDVEVLIELAGKHPGFTPLSRFPDVIRDSALLLDEEISAAEVMRIITRSKVKYMEDAVLFDLYTGKGIPDGKKSLAVRIRYRDLEKTLTEEEVSKAHGRLIKSLCQQLGAEIR